MSVGADGDDDAAVTRPANYPPVEIQPVRIGVDLQYHSGFDRFADHRVQIHRVGVAGEQQSAGGVADDGQVGVVHCRQHASGHVFLAHVEAAVHRCDYEVEPLEDSFVVIHPPILQDVGLDAFQHPKAIEPAVDLIDLVRLSSKIIRPQSAGVGSSLAVVGNAEVLVPGVLARHGQLLDGVGAVRVARVAVEKSLEILLGDQPGYRTSCRGVHLTGAFAELGRYELQAKGLIERLLVRSSNELTSPP